MPGKETLLTISRRTGFSVSTVSRALSGKGSSQRISQSTIDLIKAEAENCNYKTNLLAKSLRTRRSKTVGLIVPSVDNPYFASLASVITGSLKDRGYNLLLGDSMESVETEEDLVDSFVCQSVDGLIVVPCGESSAFLEEVGKSLPLVLVDRYFEKTSLPYVSTNNYEGGFQAADYLLRKGYRNIVAIQGLKTSMPSRERVRGFEDAVRKWDSEPVRYSIMGSAFSIENGYNCTLEAFSGKKRPDALLALSVTILQGAVKALRELGLRIPEDVAVFSYDNNPFLDYLNPPITRIAQPLSLMGSTAVDMLLQVLENATSPQSLLVKPYLITGQSA